MTTTRRTPVWPIVAAALVLAAVLFVLFTDDARGDEPPIIPGPPCPAPLGRLDAEQIDQSRGGECWCLAPGHVGFFGWVGVDGYEGRDPAECPQVGVGPAVTVTNPEPPVLEPDEGAYPLDPPTSVPPSPPATPIAGQPAFTG